MYCVGLTRCTTWPHHLRFFTQCLRRILAALRLLRGHSCAHWKNSGASTDTSPILQWSKPYFHPGSHSKTWNQKQIRDAYPSNIEALWLLTSSYWFWCTRRASIVQKIYFIFLCSIHMRFSLEIMPRAILFTPSSINHDQSDVTPILTQPQFCSHLPVLCFDLITSPYSDWTRNRWPSHKNHSALGLRRLPNWSWSHSSHVTHNFGDLGGASFTKVTFKSTDPPLLQSARAS